MENNIKLISFGKNYFFTLGVKLCDIRKIFGVNSYITLNNKIITTPDYYLKPGETYILSFYFIGHKNYIKNYCLCCQRENKNTNDCGKYSFHPCNKSHLNYPNNFNLNLNMCNKNLTISFNNHLIIYNNINTLNDIRKNLTNELVKNYEIDNYPKYTCLFYNNHFFTNDDYLINIGINYQLLFFY